METLLKKYADKPLPIDEIQAVFVGVGVGPELIMPSEYIPLIFGVEEMPEFKSKKDFETTYSLIFELYNETLQSIDEGKFEPIFAVPEGADSTKPETMDAHPWCSAFYSILFYYGDEWLSEQNEELLQILMPLSYFVNPVEYEKETGKKTKKEKKELKVYMMAMIPVMVKDLRKYFQKNPYKFSENEEPHNIYKLPKTSDKTGRNDPCPCGSGKKYKQCCGKN